MSEGLTGPRKTLLFITLVFILPVLLAYGAYFSLGWWQPQATTNYGELVVPAHPLTPPPKLLNLTSQQPGKPSVLQGHWSLLFLGDGHCEKMCMDNLYKTRQVRIGLNKDIHRVQRLFFTKTPFSAAKMDELAKQHPDLQVFTSEAALLSAFSAPFPMPAGTAKHNGVQLFLVDPLGNLMMRYPPDYEAKGLLKDFRRLLKISQVG